MPGPVCNDEKFDQGLRRAFPEGPKSYRSLRLADQEIRMVTAVELSTPPF
jgi:hypothetical protein